jgi:hypothetical protein
MVCLVEFYPEEGVPSRTFDFGALPVARDLQAALARSFARLTGPSDSRRALTTVKLLYYAIAHFARFCVTLSDPPTCGAALTTAHFDRYMRHARGRTTFQGTLANVRSTLMAMDDLMPSLRAALEQLEPPRRPHTPCVSSYSPAEMQRIVRAAQTELRGAAVRIRASLDLIARWREGKIDRAQDNYAWERGYLLDYLLRTGDVPRDTSKRPGPSGMAVRHGGVINLCRSIYLTGDEVSAACVLLISYTGVNGGSIAATSIAHHRADSGADEPAVALIDAVKPRRGRRARYMTVPLTDLPTSAVPPQTGERTPSEAGDVTTAFGVYALVRELTSAARAARASTRLFLWSCAVRGKADIFAVNRIREGLPMYGIPIWGRPIGLRTDPDKETGATAPLEVRMTRLRLTYLQRTQRPVAHAVRTLADEYLIRDDGAVIDYQRVVAQALNEQVAQARQNMRALVLRRDDVDAALRDPAPMAERFNVSIDVLNDVLAGRCDTILAGCTDHTHSPFSPAGDPCTASFLLCLSCPCARVTPQHLPMLLLVRDALIQRRETSTPLAWAQLFAGPHAQLTDVLARFSGAAIEAARSSMTETNRRHVQRLFRREWDLT